ncbi:hypothetical protein C8J57DRAFT_1238890 [Mycena rebaudengoi]|nr:hypothetical protein C8J57DRAFT_1238890 [Mycena rebaudengoi]
MTHRLVPNIVQEIPSLIGDIGLIFQHALRSHDVISQSAEHRKPKTIREIELVQFRLTGVRACVADRFDDATMDDLMLSASKDCIVKERDGTRRLGAGFVQSADGMKGYEESDNAQVV